MREVPLLHACGTKPDSRWNHELLHVVVVRCGAEGEEHSPLGSRVYGLRFSLEGLGM